MLAKRYRGDNNNRYIKKDYVCSINGAATYAIQYNQTIHARNPLVFPWLSGVSPNYERYCINGIRFIFESSSSDSMGGANPQLGRVLFYFNSDTLDAAPQNKAVLMNYSAAGSCKISDSYAYSPRFTGKNQMGELFVPEGPTVAEDETDYLWGRMIIATDGCQTTGIIGDLFVEYDVSLITPKISVGLGMNISLTQLQLTNTYGSAGANWLTNAGQTVFRNDFNATVSGEVLTFPIGTSGAFLIITTWNGIGDASAWTAPTTTPSNAVNITDLVSQTAASTTNNIGSVIGGVTLGTGVPRLVVIQTYRIVDPNLPTTITYSGGNRALTGTVTTGITITAIEPFP